MENTNFENLQIYQLSEKLGDLVWQIVLAWDGFAKDTVGKQWVRAADSVGANIAEGNGKGTTEDYRRYLRHYRGSLYESKHWLRRASNRGLLNESQRSELLLLMQELIAKLNAYMRTLNETIRKERQLKTSR